MNFSGNEKLMPQEEVLEVLKSKKKLTIGIPRETENQENRIALVPNAVGQLVRTGHNVLIENGAGSASHFNNKEYSEEGAHIVYTPDEVFEADILLKVAPLSDFEIERLRKNQIILSSLQLNTRPKNYFTRLIDKKISALAYEFIKDEGGAYPVLQAMSEIVGRAVIYIAAEYQSNTDFGKGNLVGGLPGIPPSEVVIIGAGSVGENAAATALAMGAQVKVFDNKIYKLRKLLNYVGQQVYTSVIQPNILSKALKTADIVIGAYYTGETRSECLVPEEMVAAMKYGAVIIDVSIDQGGCFETSVTTSHKNPVYRKYDVTHYCVPNIASRYAHTASYALSNFLTPLLMTIAEDGGLKNVLKTHAAVGQGVYLYNGILTRKQIGELYDIPSKDIDLLLAAL